MATTVSNNPFDTQQPSGQSGIIGGAIQAGGSGSAAQFNPQQREVNRPTETAAGQVESLLAKDSPLMQRARTLAMQNMNQRGLVNSSMAQGAGVAAMIDRITPIAQQDAETYSNRSVANMQAVNQGGMFNVGEQNKFGLQLGEQAFTKGENEAGRKFATSERVAGQAFTAEQTLATQNFQAAQADLNRAQERALADKSIEAQQALQLAQQAFQGAQNDLNRVNQRALQESQQAFQATQNNLDRQQQFQLQTASQQFQASESERNRAAELMLEDKSIDANRALELSRQSFQSQQAGLDRNQAVTLARESQRFQTTENERNRAAEIMLADKTINANAALERSRQEFAATQNGLDRNQARDLASESQRFQSTENERNRATELMLADKSIIANRALEQARQQFQSQQAQLDRNQQTALNNAAQTFQASQAEKNRATEIMLADKSINANKALETARQQFQSQQAQLDRNQQTALEKSRQNFQATQALLDREQQQSMVRLQDSLFKSGLSQNYAATLSLNTTNAINEILANKELNPDAKKVAIQNAIDNTNANLIWASTLYQTSLPTITGPNIK